MLILLEVCSLCCPAGKRMTLQDWCECPNCHMPASSQAFLAILSAERQCPMCNNEVSVQDVRQVANPLGSSNSGQQLVT